MKSLLLLWEKVADDLATQCCTSTTKDLKTVLWRTEHEGMSFLTISLPSFGKDFERSLDQGFVTRQDFQGFSWKSGLPAFLGGFLELVFDPSDGRLIDEPSVDAIHAVRQLTLMFSKLFLVSNKRRERLAMRQYVNCEHDVEAHDRDGWTEDNRSQFSRIADMLFGRVLVRIQDIVSDPAKLVPLHGPGATADSLRGNQKWIFQSWPARLDKVFSCADYLIPNYSYYESLESINIIEPDAEIPVKVISVPKTQRTPRIIAMEPTAMQFAQQALRTVIYDEVERDFLSRTLIGFLDQNPNRELAQVGSNGSLATLDLSEASDRVSCQHVEELLRYRPLLKEAIFACRSTRADVPGEGIYTLSKFASMGSALSFPIEAMVFCTLVFCGIEDELKRPLSKKDIYSFLGKVRVFGDDIIVPADYVHSVIGALSSFGMKVNHHKSFWTGKFRESCGKEYYDGHDVSVVKVRRLPPSSLRDAQELRSWVDLRNQLYLAGLWKATRWLDSKLSGILKDFPVVLETSPVLGRVSFLGYEVQKVGGRYQSPLVRGFVSRSVIPVNRLDDHYALQKWFSLRGELPLADEDHLERSGRPLVVDIKRGWFSPF